MSRRNAAVKREVLPDPLYNSVLVTKIVNQVMLDGKKGIAQSIVYTAMKIASETCVYTNSNYTYEEI